MTRTLSQSPAEQIQKALLETIAELLAQETLDATHVQDVLGKTMLGNAPEFLNQFSDDNDALRINLIKLRTALNEEASKKPQFKGVIENATKVVEILDYEGVPDLINPSLSEIDKKNTLEAFKTAPEKLKTALNTWENMTDQSLKADTAILFRNGRWIINLQGCPGVLFDPQGIVNTYPPSETNWKNNGIQKLQAKNGDGTIDLGEHYYFNRAGAEKYIQEHGESLNLKLSDGITDDISRKYDKDLYLLLGVDLISFYRPGGDLNRDDLGSFTNLRLSGGRCLRLNSRSVGTVRNHSNADYGVSPLFQDTSDT